MRKQLNNFLKFPPRGNGYKPLGGENSIADNEENSIAVDKVLLCLDGPHSCSPPENENDPSKEGSQMESSL
jgi:hypothetical protein